MLAQTITISIPILVAGTIMFLGVLFAIHCSVIDKRNKVFSISGSILMPLVCCAMVSLLIGILVALGGEIIQVQAAERITTQALKEYSDLEVSAKEQTLKEIDPQWQNARTIFTAPNLSPFIKLQLFHKNMPEPTASISIGQYDHMFLKDLKCSYDSSDWSCREFATTLAQYIDVEKTDPLTEFKKRNDDILQSLKDKLANKEE